MGVLTGPNDLSGQLHGCLVCTCSRMHGVCRLAVCERVTIGSPHVVLVSLSGAIEVRGVVSGIG